MVNASATHLGVCLQQQLRGKQKWQPLRFFSKKLETAQQKYSAFDRELFACYSGIRHFRHMQEGIRFTIYTDHKPLTYTLVCVSDMWTAHPRHTCWGRSPTIGKPCLAIVRFLFQKADSHRMVLLHLRLRLASRFLRGTAFPIPPGGSQVSLLTEHEPLVSALSRVSPPWLARQQHKLAFLFLSDIRHTPVHANVVTDTLSRPPTSYMVLPTSSAAVSKTSIIPIPIMPARCCNACTRTPCQCCVQPVSPVRICQPLVFTAIAAIQPSCPDVAMIQSSTSQERLVSGSQLLGDISTSVLGPFLPAQFRTTAIQSLHGVHHPGFGATCCLVASPGCLPEAVVGKMTNFDL